MLLSWWTTCAVTGWSIILYPSHCSPASRSWPHIDHRHMPIIVSWYQVSRRRLENNRKQHCYGTSRTSELGVCANWSARSFFNAASSISKLAPRRNSKITFPQWHTARSFLRLFVAGVLIAGAIELEVFITTTSLPPCPLQHFLRTFLSWFEESNGAVGVTSFSCHISLFSCTHTDPKAYRNINIHIMVNITSFNERHMPWRVFKTLLQVQHSNIQFGAHFTIVMYTYSHIYMNNTTKWYKYEIHTWIYYA